MKPVDEVLVIGAGPAGLSVAKALKDHGIAYDQVDSSDRIGGIWCHGVYDSVHLISSRLTTEFPEFRMPATYPDFPDRQQILDYLNAYAAHFRLIDSIRFRTTVAKVEPAGGNAWRVSFDNGESRIYRGVVICNGHHSDRRWPNYPGKLTAEYIHSKDYKTPDQLRGKRVLVIGGGNSGCDIVSEAARIGASAHLSLRRGYWFLPKVLFGRPIAELGMHHHRALWLQRLFLRWALRIAVGSYRHYGLPEPDHKLFEHHPTISSELFQYLKHGQIVVHPDIRAFDGNVVEFADGTSEAFDIVVAATGFHLSFPFLAPELVAVNDPLVEVYGAMMTTLHRHLYIVGWMQARYGFGPLFGPKADLLAQIIKTQDRMRNSFGSVMKQLGQKPPRTNLFDPHRIKRQVNLMRHVLPFVRLIDGWIKPSVQ